ncbi:MAG: hypothetical protein Kow0090_22810 [Myxococcota bacterium]
MKNISVVFLFLLAFSQARAATLFGQVINGLTGEPVDNAIVSIPDIAESRKTDEEGNFSFSVEEGTYSLDIFAPGFHPVRYVNQWTSLNFHSTIKLIPRELNPVDRIIPYAIGIPLGSGPAPDEEPIDLSKLPSQNGSAAGGYRPMYSIGDTPLPTTIRIGRRFASTCSGNPVQRIDEIELEEYVMGVVYSEIGVFKSVKANPPIENPKDAYESFKLFAVAARSYAFWWYLKNPDAEYHLDDTACNQRYEDARLEVINNAVLETAGEVFVKASDHNIVDKYEYAASDGRTGCRPWGTTDIIPDDPPVRACVGTWCGHDNCAAHEDNPLVEGSDRCLVRGICQWGSAERSLMGHTYLQMAKYYQPYLDVVNLRENGETVEDAGEEDTSGEEDDSGEEDVLTDAESADDAGEDIDTSKEDATQLDDVDAPDSGDTALVGYVRETDPTDGKNISGAVVSLTKDDAKLKESVTDKFGYFEFRDIPAGGYVVAVSAKGYYPATVGVDVKEGEVNWVQIALFPAEEIEPPEDDGGEEGDGSGESSGEKQDGAGESADGGEWWESADVGDTGEEDDFFFPSFDSYSVNDGCGCRIR